MVTTIGDRDLSTGYLMAVNSDGSINVGSIVNTVPVSGNLSIESVFVASGNMFITSGNVTITNPAETGSIAIQTVNGSIVEQQTIPIDSSKNNSSNQFLYVTSGTATGVTGSEVGSIVQFIGAGSFVQVFTWSNDNIVTIGSWV